MTVYIDPSYLEALRVQIRETYQNAPCTLIGDVGTIELRLLSQSTLDTLNDMEKELEEATELYRQQQGEIA